VLRFLSPNPEGTLSDLATRSLRLPRWLPATALVLLVFAGTLAMLPNAFVQDDLPIIFANKLVHTLKVWPLFVQAYWPTPYPRELYRPLTSVLFALEWAIGGGRATAFRLTSILLYALATLAVWRLARRVLRPGPAWLAAALFAVDPLHVEAVAVGVNQAELIVGALLAWLMTIYIDVRRAGQPLQPRWIAGMALAYFITAMFKEHGLLLPALMLAAEVTVIDDGRRWRDRVVALRPLFLILALVAVSFVAIRSAALGGDTKGSFTAEALGDLSWGNRVLTMLRVAPEWLRLFVWPAHLQADYSPQEIVSATHWGWWQTLGAISLLVPALIAWLCRRTRPAVTFGLLWTAVGMALVCNLIVSTGIVLAERTLFTASIGVVIAGADALWLLGERTYSRGSFARVATVTAAAVLFFMAITRSASRDMVWRNLTTLWVQTGIDAPNSYRGQQALGSVLFAAGLERAAEYHYKRSMELFPKAWATYLEFADKLRQAGNCPAAVHYYQEVLLKTPVLSGPRASEVACLVYMGAYTHAAAEARLGISYGGHVATFAMYAHVADSAEAVHAPPKSVRLPDPVDSTLSKP
jgi:tetratricopeptide (TPR) repeat protein